MPEYNKLVRDKIPEILTKRNKKFVYHIANKAEYSRKLNEKLLEEVGEFLDDPCIEELADIQEVLFALLENMGETQSRLSEVQGRKAAERGRFSMGLILESVDE